MSKIQNSDVKSQAELVSAGATAAQLINDTKIYVTANSLNKRLDEAITAGDIGGGSSTGTVFELKATELISGWSTGNNAAPLGGGSLAGTFVKDSSTPLNGTDSYVYTQAGGSLNDYILSPAQAVARRYRGTTCTLYLPYQYDGGGSDVSVVIYDATNAVVLTQNALTVIPASNGATNQYQLPIVIPSTCASIRVGFQVGVANSGKILRFDDVVLSSNNALNAPLANITAWQSFTPTGSWTANTTYVGRLRQVGEMVEVQCLVSTSGAPTAGALTINMPSGYVIDTSKLASGATAGVSLPGSNGVVYDNAFGEYLVEVVYNTTTVVGVRRVRTGTGTNSVPVNSSASVGHTDPFTWGAGDYASISFTVPCVGLTATSPSIVTASESFSTDTASLTYAGSAQYTLSTLANAPVGTFITFTTAANSNARTQTNAAAPTQATSSMNTNGIQLFARAYNAASTSGNPASIAIQIGKNFKGLMASGYSSTAKVNAISLDMFISSTTVQRGTVVTYEESTGILQIDCSSAEFSANTARSVGQDATGSAVSNGYIVINASKSPALVGVPQLQPRFATIQDVKSAGTVGGAATAGAWTTHTLNTLVDSTGIVTSLSSNQFVLQPGTYHIFGDAQFFRTNECKVRIQNITAGTSALIGESGYSDGTNGGHHSPIVCGEITITAATTFELQWRGGTTKTINGLGVASNFGVNEVYATVQIQKIK